MPAKCNYFINNKNERTKESTRSIVKNDTKGPFPVSFLVKDKVESLTGIVRKASITGYERNP